MGLISKSNIKKILHAFLYISLPFLHEYGLKMTNLTFYGVTVREQAPKKFYFSFWSWTWFLGIQLLRGFTYIWHSKWVRKVAMKTERTQVKSLLWRRFRRCRILGSLLTKTALTSIQGTPPFRGHFPRSQGCPLNRGSTVLHTEHQNQLSYPVFLDIRSV